MIMNMRKEMKMKRNANTHKMTFESCRNRIGRSCMKMGVLLLPHLSMSQMIVFA
jgi:hypothetical protein